MPKYPDDDDYLSRQEIDDLRVRPNTQQNI
jgi:hypothetical protein